MCDKGIAESAVRGEKLALSRWESSNVHSEKIFFRMYRDGVSIAIFHIS